MADMSEKFEERYRKYRKDYDLDSLNDSNDTALLRIVIQYEILIEELQQEINNIIRSGNLKEEAQEIKKLSDLLRDMTNVVVSAQKTLSIDRKSRQEVAEQSPLEYIRFLKRNAHQFLNKRLIKIYCDKCKVMVGRISPVHEHTAYNVSFECSQCGRMINAQRLSKDVFHDVKDKEWREKYPIEILSPEKENEVVDLSIIEIADEYNLPGEEDQKFSL